MTNNEAYNLKVGDSIMFTYSYGKQVKGEVVRTSNYCVKIEWNEGWFGSYGYDSLDDQFELENVS